ncbi:MAG: Smr/MutS family protein [Pseudomonadota bacterium]
MNRRPLKPGERALWERVARTVVPLKPAQPKKVDQTPAPDASHRGNVAQALPPHPGGGAMRGTPADKKMPAKKTTAPTRAAVGDLDRTTRRKLSRGVVAIDGRIDLHGMTQEEAHRALRGFVSASFTSDRRVVLVITGKGRGGEGSGILRRAVPLWLSGRDLQPMVVSFGPAHPNHGGDGALYVRLRSKSRLKSK